MATVLQVLESLPEADRDRIAAALALMNRQAIGSEKYREEARCWTKEDKTPVSVADLLHQTQVQQLLATRFPDDGLVAEEPRALQQSILEEGAAVSKKFYGVDLRSELHAIPDRGDITWMLDPIDGTKGYLAGRYYAIALGFFRGDAPYFGAMAVPHAPRAEKTAIDNAIAFAVRGKGAWMAAVTESGDLDFQPLRTDRQDVAKPYRVAVSLEHAGALGEAFSKGDFTTSKMDSQAKYLAVAANALDAYARQCRDDGGTDVAWDHVPGALIAMEAGASVTNFDGSPVEFRPEPVARFKGGMICHRGPVGGSLGTALRGLLNTKG